VSTEQNPALGLLTGKVLNHIKAIAATRILASLLETTDSHSQQTFCRYSVENSTRIFNKVAWKRSLQPIRSCC